MFVEAGWKTNIQKQRKTDSLCGLWCERNSSCGDATSSLAPIGKHRYRAPTTHRPRTELHAKCRGSSNVFHTKTFRTPGHASQALTAPLFPSQIYNHSTRLQTRLTFGYVLDVIITRSSASPGLLCGPAFCNYCQYSRSRHISHTQASTHELSHAQHSARLHIRGE